MRLAGVVVFALGVCAVSARAEVEGQAPSKVGNWRVFGAHSATGAASLVPGPYLAEINSVLLSSSTAQITDLPYDAHVEAAFLFWAGSLPRAANRTTILPADRDVDFTTADGSFYPDLSVDSDLTGFGRCVTTPGLGGHYTCRRDVTELLRAQGPGNANGIYQVGDVSADPGALNGGDPQWVNAQAKFAGWTVVIVWSSSTETVRRDVVLYDGFLRLDEANSAGMHRFNVDSFLVGSPALGRLTVSAFEGDRQLGVPPQDSTGCPTCYDYISFKSATASTATKLSDGANPANNSFNSSWMGQASIDIDSYSLTNLIATGDTSAQIEVASGDGLPGGDGESFHVAWVVMSIDTLTPNFKGNQTRMRVSPAVASSGQTLFYTLDVVNQGSAAATGVLLQSAIPVGTEYVPGSVRVDGVPRADVAGTSALVAGLSLNSIPTAQVGDHTRQITFQVRVLDAACGGQVTAQATLRANEIEAVTLGPVQSDIQAVLLDAPEKALSFISGTPHGPGAVFTYTMSVHNPGGLAVGGVELSDTLPDYVHVASVFASSGTVTRLGRDVSVHDMNVPANGTAQVVVTGRVFSVSELAAAGVVEADIDGLEIENQARAVGGCGPVQLSVDPRYGFGPTRFALTYRPVLTSSQKSATDINGGYLEPGDVVRFAITAQNTGNRVASITLQDPIPANTVYVAGSTRLDGVLVADVGGASALVAGLALPGVPYVGDNDRLATFDVTVDASAANGALVQNRANLLVPVQPAANVSVNSAPLTVVAAPLLTTSVKTVTDLTAPVGTFKPGDEVEYTVSVINSGNRPATALDVTDVLPGQLTFVSATQGGTLTAGVVRWTWANLAPGATQNFTVRARVASPLDNGTQVSNRAVVDCAELDAFTTPDVTFTITSAPHMVASLVDEHSSLPPRPGQALTYRLSVRNQGDMLARNVTVQMPVDVALENVAAAGGTVTGATVQWTSATDSRLAQVGSQAIELLVSARIKTPLVNGTVVVAQANVAGTGFVAVQTDDPDVAGTADPTRFSVVSQASLTVTKRVTDLSSATPFVGGDTVRYDLELVATGDAPLRNVVVEDVVPSELTNITQVVGGSVSAANVVWNPSTLAALAQLNPGARVNASFTATVRMGFADATVVSNQASATSQDLGVPVLSDDPSVPGMVDPTRFSISAAPILVSTLSVRDTSGDPRITKPGDNLEYTLTLTNQGGADASAVVATLNVPLGLVPHSFAGGAFDGAVLRYDPTTDARLQSMTMGASITFVLQTHVDNSVAGGTTLSLQAQVDSSQTQPVLSDDPATLVANDATLVTVVTNAAGADLATSTKQFVDPTTGQVLQSARPGEVVRILITVKNTGGQAAQNVRVQDVLDPSRLGQITLRDGGTLSGDTAQWTLASVAPGVPAIVRVDARLLTPQSPGVLTNQAFLGVGATPDIPTDDPSQPGLSDATRLTIQSAPILSSFRKTVSAPQAGPGETLTYSLSVSNTGDAHATNVVVTDVLPLGLELVSAPGASFDASTQTLTYALGQLLATQSREVSFVARVLTSTTDGMLLQNQAVLTAAELVGQELSDDAQSTNPDTPTTTLVRVAPRMALHMTVEDVDAGFVLPGDSVVYTLTLTNAGNADATDLEIRNTIDSAVLTNVTVGREARIDANDIVFDSATTPRLLRLTPGESVSFSFTANLVSTLAEGTEVQSQASVLMEDGTLWLSDADPSTVNVLDPTVIALRFPVLASTKVADARVVEPSGLVRFTLTASNNGSLPATSVILTDTLNAAFALVDAPQATVNALEVQWTLPELGAGQTATFSLVTQLKTNVASGTDVPNQAVLVAEGVASVLSDWPVTPASKDPTLVTVRALPNLLATSKTLSQPRSSVTPGEEITYLITVPNEGGGEATQVVVRDVLAPELELVEAPGALVSGDEISFLADALPAGERLTFEITARVADHATDGLHIANQAFVTANELAAEVASDDPHTAAVDDPTMVTVVAKPALQASTLDVIDINGGTVQPGDRLRYVMMLRNTGSLASTETRLQLAMPSYTQYIPLSTHLNDVMVSDAGANSPLVNGMSVRSAAVGTPVGVLQRLGHTTDDETATVTFEVRVDPRANLGTLVSAQAAIWASNVERVGTDNPRTPDVIGDATTVVVGGGGHLVTHKTWSLVQDGGAAGLAEVGDTLRYTLVVNNAGDAPALAVELEDVLPVEVHALVNSIKVNGMAVSDAVDADAAQVSLGVLTARLGDLAPGSSTTVTLDVGIDKGPVIANQAQVHSNGRTTLSDGDLVTVGEQATITAVGQSSVLLVASLEAHDENGGVFLPDDLVRYRLTIKNQGSQSVGNATAQISKPQGLVVSDAVGGTSSTLLSNAPPTWEVGPVAPGQSIAVEYVALAETSLVGGTVVEATGFAQVGAAVFAADPVRLVSGSGAGTSLVRGHIFRDVGNHDGQFGAGDEGLAGYSVLLVPAGALEDARRDVDVQSLALRAVNSQRGGTYEMAGVPPGNYALWVMSPEGTQYGASPQVQVLGGTTLAQDFAVDPSGIIYKVEDGNAQPVAGARVFLVNVDTGADVDRLSLFAGQQGQITTGQGFYRFDVRSSALPGRFAIRVETPSELLSFPSEVRLASGATLEDLLGLPAQPPPSGRIVDNDFPDPAANTTYYLRFDLDANTPNITNNHIPLDNLAERLRITKIASRRTAELGDMVTYTVTITNPTRQTVGSNIVGSGQTLTLVDDMSAGMRWVDTPASRVVRQNGRVVETGRVEAERDSQSPRTTRFGPLSLPPQSTVAIRYYAVVGLNAQGEQTNRARLLLQGAAVSNEAQARVRIELDPIFEEGTLLGRVFCDDGDGVFNGDEAGLLGARVYLDTGFYVDTDADGKFHIRGIVPGRHVVKLDMNTTPPDAVATTDVTRDFLLTKGLLAKIDFGVTCSNETVKPALATAAPAPLDPTAPPNVVAVIDQTLPAIALNGDAQPLLIVDAVLSAKDGAANFDAREPLSVAPGSELVWNLRAPDRIAIERWEVSVFGQDSGQEVWRVWGLATPPPRIPWKLSDAPTMAPGIYLYRVVMTAPNGDLGEGVWRRLVVGVPAKASADKPETLATWRGDLFKPESAEPTEELVQKSTALAADLIKRNLPDITLEVHTNDDARRSANLMASQRQAVTIRNLLVKQGVPADKIAAIGKGDTEPIMPNVTSKARALNKRVVVTFAPMVQPATNKDPSMPLLYAGHLQLGSDSVHVPEERVEAELSVQQGDPVLIDLRQPSGKRVRIVRPFPLGQTSTTNAADVAVPFAGSLSKGELSVAGVAVPLPLWNATCGVAGSVPEMNNDMLVAPVRFTIGAKTQLSRWLVRVLNPEGTVLTDIAGKGQPPESIEWNGKNDAGQSIVRAGTYGFRCLLTDAANNRVVTEIENLTLGKPSSDGALFEKILSGTAYPEAGNLSADVVAELDKATALMLATPGAKLELEVYDDAEGGKMQAQIRTARLASELKTYFAGKGVNEASIDTSAFGATKPLMPGESRRAIEMNRRVVVRVTAGKAAPPTATPSQRVRVASETLALDEAGVFSGSVTVAGDSTIVVDMANTKGRGIVYTVPLFMGRPEGSAQPGMPTSGVPEGPHLGSSPASLGLDETSRNTAPEGETLSDAKGEASRESAPPVGAEDVALEPLTGAKAARVFEASGKPTLYAPSGKPVLQKPSGPRLQYFAPSGPALRYFPASGPRLRYFPPSGPVQPIAPPAELRPAPKDSGAAQELPLEPLTVEPLPSQSVALTQETASDLYVYLPKEGALLKGERLTVRGRTDLANVVTINGIAAPVDAYGRFGLVVALPAGDATIEVLATDPQGNQARVHRSYNVPDRECFFLGLADARGGVGPGLAGDTNSDTLDLGNDWYLHGRAVGYFKGRIKGRSLSEKSPFEEFRLTAHVDTGKQDDDFALRRQLIDPSRYYATYGDGTEEVQDVSSREKVYVRLEADKSRLVVGNFQATLSGELFRYQRTLFGAAVDVDHAFVKNAKTEVHAFAADGENGVRPRRVVLQGTGGALYFLRDANIVEGSERVEIVVRDAITGAKLLSLPQARDADYRMDYTQGRLAMSQPIPGAVTTGLFANQNPSRALVGNPVFVEVTYDFGASAFDNDARTLAFQARQQLGVFTLGAGVVDEDRTGSGAGRYQLWGAEAHAKIGKESELGIEVAHSRAQDAEHFVSLDGGITFGTIGTGPLRDTPQNGGGPVKRSGFAGTVQLAGDLGEWVGRPQNTPESQSYLPYVLTLQHQDPGFFAAGGLFEQGQSKVGAQLRYLPTDKDAFRLRYDGVQSTLFSGTDELLATRHLSSVGYERKEKDWKAGVELGHTYAQNQGQGDGVQTGIAAVYGEKRLTSRLTAFGEQEGIVGGNDLIVTSTWDRFATTAGARYELTEVLSLSATETLRWSGTNSTQVGLKAQLDDNLSVYASERLTAGSQDLVSTTIVGAESHAIVGSRSYAEYQLDSLASGESGRAIFGMENRWQVLPGLKLNLAYERAQLVGRSFAAQQTPTGYAVANPGFTGNGSGALNYQQQFSASGYSSAGVFPVGVSSRDAFSVGFEYLHSTVFKAGTRFELRYDRGDKNVNTPDRLVFFGQGGGDWRFERDFVFLGRVQGASVENLDLHFLEGQFLDISAGLAFRPARSNRVNALLKWTRRYERRSIAEDNTLYQLEIKDVLAFEPALELGWGFQFVGKLALKISEVTDEFLPVRRSTTALTIARLNYHVTSFMDASGEYRWLTNVMAQQTESGALLEIAWLPVKYVAVGVGYNFTHFSDDLLASANTDAHGAFLRVTGRY